MREVLESMVATLRDKKKLAKLKWQPGPTSDTYVATYDGQRYLLGRDPMTRNEGADGYGIIELDAKGHSTGQMFAPLGSAGNKRPGETSDYELLQELAVFAAKGAKP